MRIEELKLIPSSKRSSAVLIEFMKEHERGLKAIKTLTEIKELLLKTSTNSQEHCVNAKSVILQKISEVEE